MVRLLAMAFILSGSITFAQSSESVEGVVQVVGARVNAKILLTAPKENSGPNLCAGDLAKRVKKVPAMTVKVIGTWKNEGDKRCFQGDSFTITKGTSGRPAFTGILEKNASQFILKRESGAGDIALYEVPEGMKKLQGKRVVLDLKELDNPTSKSPAQRVVFYAEHP